MSQRAVTLGSIAKITSGGTPDRNNSAYWNGNIPWVKTSQIQNGTITSEDIDEWITKDGLDKSSTKIIPKGTILMAMYGQGKTRGQVAILGLDATINQACAAIHLHQGVDRDYVYQQFLFRYESIRALSNTGGQENLNANLIREIAFPLPELREQVASAKLLVEWDAAIEKTERLIAAKERYYTHELFRLISHEHHQHTHLVLVSIATIWKGQQLNKEAMVDDGKFYVLNGGIGPSGQTTSWNCEANTVTISEGGNSCGFVNFNHSNFWCGGHCYALKNLRSDVDAHYLFHYLKGRQQQVMSLRVGSGLPNIQKADIESFPVILPKLDKQVAIARYLNTLREEIAGLEIYVEMLKAQKRGLMQKLLTGIWRAGTAEETIRS